MNLTTYLGEQIKIKLTAGAELLFHVTGCGTDYLDGYDHERMNLRIATEDIEFVYGMKQRQLDPLKRFVGIESR